MPKVSVITINKNNAYGLEKTIVSVINQLYFDLEYIVIDGGSTDNSVDIIRKYSEHINTWSSESDNGIYHAMNKGIQKAKGEYILFMNSGDIFLNNQTLSDIFALERNADMLTGYIILDEKKVKLQKTVPDKITFYHFFKSTLWHQATFTKREILLELGGYDEKMKIAADWKFALLAIILNNKSVEVIKQNIALVDTTGISGKNESLNIIREEQKETFMTYFPYFYDDYKKLHKFERFTFNRIKEYLIWRLRYFLKLKAK